MISDIAIPKPLVDEVLKGNVILFLGAGASFGATHPTKSAIPLGNTLRDLIVNRFLDETYLNESLAHVAEVSISEYSLFEVQNYIADIFDKFSPADYHLLIPQFKWRAIFTTNYDLIVERAYEKDSNRLQDLKPIVQNVPIERLLLDKNTLLYFKLHGCIRYANIKELPLVLTLDQYSKVHDNRDRLFTKLEEFATEYTFLFVGYSNSDSDIRNVFKKLEILDDARPRSYFIAPKIREAEIRMLAHKRITAIPLTFNDFLNKLNEQISPANRKLSSIYNFDYELPIHKKFVNDFKTEQVTNSFLPFITTIVDYINPNLSSEHTDAKDFYKGSFRNWDPILKNLDVERRVADTIILKAFLDERRESTSPQQLHIIKGNAGSGKSVLLKRIAWKAGTEFDKLCLFYKENAPVVYDNLYEVYHLCKERLYVFIDDALHYSDYIIHILNKASKDNIPITVVGCARNNEYNTDGDELSKYVTESYELTYLNDQEIRNLLGLLERHKSLNHLEGKPFKEQVDAFAKKSGRELLVALYEATQGKTFAEIITDEYNKISTVEAKSLYLTVSILHRLGRKARAGFISRLHKIRLVDFKSRLFEPLEHIVFDTFNTSLGDYEYSTRHQQIAEMIFENVLKNEQDRFDEYLRIISYLDIDYENDRLAFRAMTNAKKLKEIFRDTSMVKDLYRAARDRSTNDPYLLQQNGIYEMAYGNSEIAYKYLTDAQKIVPSNLSVTHSLAEYEFKMAENSSNSLKRDSYLTKAEGICKKALIKDRSQASFYHTLIKISLLRLEDLLDSEDIIAIERKIKETQQLLSDGLTQCGDEEFLLDGESRFHQLLKNSPAALASLERAFEVNKRSPYISLRLARFYESNGDIDKAIGVLEETLVHDNFNRDVNYKLGLLYLNNKTGRYNDALYYLKRSFVSGDSNHIAQYQYARVIFLTGQDSEAKSYFEILRDLPISNKHKKQVRDYVRVENKLKIFSGSIVSNSIDYAFIKMDGSGISVYSKINDQVRVRPNDRVTFNIGFNYFGPVAVII